VIRGGVILIVVLLACGVANAADPADAGAPAVDVDVTRLLPDLKTPEGVSSVLKYLLLLTVLSVAPAIVIMVTCFTRIIVVLGLVRQALSTQNLPPNSILFGLALLMTLVVMAPVYADVHRDAVAPYLDGKIPQEQAIETGTRRVRTFMTDQIEAAGNEADVYLFLDEETAAKEKITWAEVPTLSLIPAYVLSELKVAFMMGFRIYLPFVVIDMLVASTLVSMGMLMLPPMLISLPFKLLLFVLADGWRLVAGTLMTSF
jgi:flagellar biosynthesis protein FliP